MDVRKLEAFCRVYELENFSKAGELMFLSQPTISSHVANLEEELGVRLFDRMGRKVMATQAGHVLYRSAKSVFETLEQAKASIELLRDKVTGELLVGCSTIPSYALLPEMLSGFSVQYPEVRFTIETRDSAEVIKHVASGDWPVGIVGKRPEEDSLAAELLAEDEIVVVASADATWLPPEEGPISLETLVKLPWVMRERGSGTRNVLELALNKAGKSLQALNVRCLIDSTCNSIAHTVGGLGVTVTSLLATKELLDRGELKRLDVPELAGKRRFYLIYHRDRHMFPALKTFIDYARR
ncbi:LysR family transcriptional regulator [Pseudodesulfovibrio cashew]|uniref:LysR family transcriptional regulator n=1 Tax=Pseudodesulfovibrio cashew TaxID=2678688 RepID=A0A6I6JT34_9BACT|nr:selenium metabolism-associated LysR family transcriptional regulator [Pseudodesulfovibrio cashew]QGY40784.1 LysR family transcriptional regulator [Pseudodesulfovibrio cashew]